ncbi:MAG: hypothetical protein IKN38_09080 [Clostridia bacterium]|nr:hypothetical protein [Clostridia bacterium]
MESKTVRLFDEDAYLFDFTADIVSSEEREGKYLCVLDKTAFFPEGGGQSSDTGTVGDARVTYVFEKDGVIYHETDRPLAQSKNVPCSIDRNERLRKMQSHTGEHVLCGTAHRLWGAENVGFHLSEEYVRVDLDVYLDHEKVEFLEREANRAIAENHPVTAWYPTPEELGTVEYRSKDGITGDVRLVKIEDVDVCACCAPHVRSTAEIGLLKVVDSIKYKGGTRLEIVCGPDAVELFIAEHKELSLLAESYSVKRSELSSAIERQRAELLDLTHELKASKTELMKYKLEALEPKDSRECFFFDNEDPEVVRTFLNGAAAKFTIAAGFIGADGNYRYIIRSDKVDLKSISKEINDVIAGRGGGSSVMIQGSCSADRGTIENYFKD